MIPKAIARSSFLLSWLGAAGLTTTLMLALGAGVKATPISTLRIGTAGSLAATAGANREAAVLDTLRDFIKSETGFTNEIVKQESWQQLGSGLMRGQVHLGFFQGYEFASAQEKFPELKPLALTVNVHRYPTVHVLAQQNDKAESFADLQGRSIALPPGGGNAVRLFIDRQSEAQGSTANDYFTRITHAPTVEDALDDLVDGIVQAAAVERVALEAFKRLKPGRFARLKEVTRSQPFPPPLLAYCPGTLDDATLEKFRSGLLQAGQTNRGQTLMTHFRLTGFELPPLDFDRVLAETRRIYPAPGSRE